MNTTCRTGMCVGLVSWFAPTLAYAEIADKIPSIGELAIANAIVVLLSALVAYALRRHAVAQMALLVPLVVVASGVIFELRFSDIAEAVTRETGAFYPVLVWSLAVVPGLFALFGVVRRLLAVRG